jgi:hypothetical protein
MGRVRRTHVSLIFIPSSKALGHEPKDLGDDIVPLFSVAISYTCRGQKLI